MSGKKNEKTDRCSNFFEVLREVFGRLRPRKKFFVGAKILEIIPGNGDSSYISTQNVPNFAQNFGNRTATQTSAKISARISATTRRPKFRRTLAFRRAARRDARRGAARRGEKIEMYLDRNVLDIAFKGAS